jgi:site-specific DNA recombinase
MYRVGAYARVSTEREEQESSLVNQQLMFEKYVKDNNWMLTELYIDRKSGTKGKRPELLRLIEDIQEKRIDVVLFKDLSRMARNGELSYRIANLLKEKNVQIITLDGMINSLENNVDMLGLLAWLYEKESENQSKRIKSIKKLGASNGKYQGSTPPYGYQVINGKLFVREDETPAIVQRIFKEYLNGTGVDTIAKSLTIEGQPTPAQVIQKKNAGMNWMGSSIKTILSNPHYVGDLVQGRTTTISVVSTKRKENKNEEYIIVRGTHEPIITKDVFVAVQKQIQKRKKNQTAPKAHLFTNISYCADCGKGMWYRSGGRYICGSYGRYGVNKCTSHSIKEDKLASAIINDFKIIFKSQNLLIQTKHLEEKVKKTFYKTSKELDKIKSKLSVLQNRKVKYAEMIADGEIDIETFQNAINANDKDIKVLKSKLTSLQTNDINQEINITSMEKEFIDYLYSTDVLPELIHRFISRIEIVEGGTPNIFYNFQEPQNTFNAC